MTSDGVRTQHIIDVLTDAFSELAAADPPAFRRKYRTMAADPFAFYRGTACLFYADVAGREDRWADERTSRVWIQGDLHVENFGTYMDSEGVLVFDVNDYDEAYLGHFTWDLQRLAASLAVMGWTKAMPDEDIADLIRTYLRAYLDQVHTFVDDDRDHEWSLRLGTARGAVRDALLAAQLSTRVDLLDKATVVADYERRFRHSPTVRELDAAERDVVEAAFRSYLDTIPVSKRLGSLTYDLKDVVGKSGFGIGSAGLPAYNLLVEGRSQALENDVVLTMKQGSVAAPSRVVQDRRARDYFEHEGHRTAVSQRALQARSDPWLGWARMQGGPHDGVGFVVQEFSPYEADLDWSVLSEADEMEEVLEQLGRATAKVHCVSDVDDATTPLVDFQTEDAIVAALDGAEDEFVDEVVAFGLEYGARARADHALFVDAFRGGQIPGVGPRRSRG
ncbi:DUF2252 domain-containing protein [Cellulomonas aerilata]|uniref:DUF2252 domain-containing protein n=1 Tax=Cellulomonas aerilata TaxID=515326 RepID=A0A512D7W0_9CELL|nr:DUF2252 domain-containing protein [Cellulomonas aerilata]GEO32592.1 hypothetical protein CAE01nite_03170 [Cellulomonas aerilata]